MAATAIYFNGRRINIPGAYSKLDASGLSAVSAAAVGIVAILGTAEGGKPLSVETDFADATRPEKIMERYRSGDLRTAALFAFDPSNDDAVPQGASRVVGVKVNPATQGSANLVDGSANNVVLVTSADWGLFVNQIHVKIAAGSTVGKKITITFEDTIEEIDNVGGVEVFDALYTPGSNGYTTMTGQVTSTQFKAVATKANVGLQDQRTAEIDGTGIVTVLSDNAGDVGQVVTVYGLIAGNVPAKATITLNGVTPVADPAGTVFISLTGVKKSAVTLGTVTVRSSVPTTLFTLAAGVLTRGLSILTNAPADGVVQAAIDAGSAGANLVVRGLNAAGAEVAQRYDMSATPVAGVQAFASITQMELADIPAARTITLTLDAALTSHSTYKYVQRVVDYLAARSGFTLTTTVANPTTFLMTDMDFAAAITLMGAAGNFFADNYAFVKAVNDNSGLITASRVAAAALGPANTVADVYLTGGSEGTTTITEWTNAFKALKARRVNQIVVLSRDPAVHSLLLSHLKERAGALRSEANGYIGIGTSGGAGETKANIKSQIQAIGHRTITALSEEMKRIDPVTGEATWYPPHFYAAVAAGMQAGAEVGEPMTHKRPNVLDVRRDSSWTVEDDSEEMIDAGLMFTENKDGIGLRFVRSVTTHRADANVVFVETSANAAADFAVYTFRTAMEAKIGRRGLAGTVGSLKGIASDVLDRLVKDKIIVAWRALAIEQVADVFPISVEIAPVLPINFIPITVHLVAVRAAA